jgi:hypothetical protein
MPFAGVYLDDQRQFDIEIWVNGSLQHVVPAQSAVSEVAYEYLEGLRVDVVDGQAPPRGAEASARRSRVLAEMRAHPGGRAHFDWESLRRMHSVQKRNAEELLAILQAPANDFGIAMEMVQNVHRPDVRDAVNAQIDQRLHNYVASSVSLIDQTRRIAKRYEGDHFHVEYCARRDALATEPVVGFVRDLRNFALHRALPFAGHTVSWKGEGDFASKVELWTADLKSWDGWKAAAKTYLSTSGESVDLLEAITAHVVSFDAMWSWFFLQYQGLHRTDVVAYDELVSESNWLLSGGAEGRPRRAWAILADGSTSEGVFDDGAT